MEEQQETHTIVFQPSGARGEVKRGTTIRHAATALGVDIESICADKATCGKCRVMVDAAPDNVTPMGSTERQWIERRRTTWQQKGVDIDRLRLSCQAGVLGDMVVFVPESSRANKQIVRKAATDRHIHVDPSIRRYYLELTPATLQDPRGDTERTAEALVETMNRLHTGDPGWVTPAPHSIEFAIDVTRKISGAIRAGDWKISATVWQNHRVIDIRPGYHDEMYGIAVDVGTTAIAAYLCDLTTGEVVASESIMNPQTAQGDDIISRMSYERERPDGLAELQRSVLGGLRDLVAGATGSAQIDPADVHEMTIVGNTTMHHLLLGLSTRSLSHVPFVPTVKQAIDVEARQLDIGINPSGNIHVLPIAASFVGADAMAVAIAEEPYEQDDKSLIIDIGTNAELIAGNRERLICTSTPTGPAFEGAHVEYGMRAAPGAIERISIDDATLEPRYTVITADAQDDPQPVKGITGSAIIDGVAEMFRTGIVTPRGHFATSLDTPRVRQNEMGWEYVIAWENETSIGRDIPITQHDVRAIQLAKAALYTAARLLLEELGIDKPDKIILAGAFGSHIDKTNAMILGMIPDCPLERVYSIGNAAGDGARIALLNKHKRLEAQDVARTIHRVELPADPAFQNEYMRALNFPHMVHPFESIADLIPLQVPDQLAEGLGD